MSSSHRFKFIVFLLLVQLTALSTANASRFDGTYEMSCDERATYRISMQAGIGEITRTAKQILLETDTFDSKIDVPVTCDDNRVELNEHQIIHEIEKDCEEFIARSNKNLDWVDCAAIASTAEQIGENALERIQNNVLTEISLDVRRSRSWFMRMLGLWRVRYDAQTQNGQHLSGTNMIINRRGRIMLSSVKLKNTTGTAIFDNAVLCSGPKTMIGTGRVRSNWEGNQLVGNFQLNESLVCGAIIDGAYLAGFNFSIHLKVRQSSEPGQ